MVVAAADATSDTLPGFAPDQLRGFRIGVTADRRADDLIAAFERRGAEVLHAPTIQMTDAEDDSAVVAATEEVIAAQPDYLLATTSYGMRQWFEVADAAGLGEALLRSLIDSTIFVRGPKARGAIRAAGLDDHGMSERETTASLVDLVKRHDLQGRTVVVQLHGYTDPEQLARLTDAGARVVTVAPYRWRIHDDGQVHRLITGISDGGLDAVTFTSPPAVQALFTLASERGRYDDVIRAFRSSVTAAAVGPITAAPLTEAGILPIVPDRFRMGALIRLVYEHLDSAQVHRLQTIAGPLELRGRLALLDGRAADLTPVTRSLLHALMNAGGAIMSRSDLAAAMGGDLDDHAVDVAISRLRQSLPDPKVVATVIRRGYRIAVA